MTTIKDSVHDHVKVRGVAAELLDTPPIQRLRRVSQLGTVSLVYPSANHTRFEHSLGVYHLADRALSQLGLRNDQAEVVRAAALLHDVGHGPFSHNLEGLLYRQTGKYHDDVEGVIRHGEIATILENHGVSPSEICSLVRGEGKLGQLVAGELDVDRMDYLVRDAHHTGVPYGTIDHGRLVRALRFVGDELVLDEGNVQTAESLLLARGLMNPTVYSHHVARIGKSMLRRATERWVAAEAIDPDRLRRMDDYQLLVGLRQSEVASEAATRIANRSLFKRAVWAEMDDVPGSVVDAAHETLAELETDIAEEADVDPRRVVVDVPSRPSMRESASRVMVNGDVRQLDEQSTLVAALRAAQREQWRLGVYTPEETTDRVGRAAERVLGLETEGALVSEVGSPRVDTRLDDF
jgi:HD superfamily phosphohydrolase